MKSLSSAPPSTVKISVHGMIVPFDRLLPNHYIIMIMEFRTYTPRCQSFSWSLAGPHKMNEFCGTVYGGCQMQKKLMQNFQIQPPASTR
jgi:hypothetical protein